MHDDYDGHLVFRGFANALMLEGIVVLWCFILAAWIMS